MRTAGVYCVSNEQGEFGTFHMSYKRRNYSTSDEPETAASEAPLITTRSVKSSYSRNKPAPKRREKAGIQSDNQVASPPKIDVEAPVVKSAIETSVPAPEVKSNEEGDLPRSPRKLIAPKPSNKVLRLSKTVRQSVATLDHRNLPGS